MAKLFSLGDVTKGMVQAISRDLPEIPLKRLTKIVKQWCDNEIEHREATQIPTDLDRVIVITDYSEKSAAYFGDLERFKSAFESKKGAAYARKTKLKFGMGFAVSNKRVAEVSDALKSLGAILEERTVQEHIGFSVSG